MKRLIFISSILFAAILSCRKDNLATKSTTSKSILGTWSLVSDSSSMTNIGSAGGWGQKYLGSSSDQFKFTSDGMMYVKEGSTIDTGVYTLRNDTLQVSYSYRLQGGLLIGGSAEWFKITSVNTHSAVLTNGGIVPGGHLALRIVTLKR